MLHYFEHRLTFDYTFIPNYLHRHDPIVSKVGHLGRLMTFSTYVLLHQLGVDLKDRCYLIFYLIIEIEYLRGHKH